MKIIPIEIDKWEDLPYKDEANKRSVQFRVLAQKINEIIEELNNCKHEVKTYGENPRHGTCIKCGEQFIGDPINPSYIFTCKVK